MCNTQPYIRAHTNAWPSDCPPAHLSHCLRIRPVVSSQYSRATHDYMLLIHIWCNNWQWTRTLLVMSGHAKCYTPVRRLQSYSEDRPSKSYLVLGLVISFYLYMMTSSNGNIFRVIGPLCGEFTGCRWIPLTKASDVELCCFPWSVPWKTVE